MGLPGATLEGFAACPILGILRGVEAGHLHGVLDAAAAAGLRFLEITLNTPHAPDLIEQAVKHYSGTLTIGAGTVLSLEDARRAQEAGAAFLVSPALNLEVAGFCQRQALPFFPGAFTPGEIEKAWAAGAAMVKVFPAGILGPDFFRQIKGPFADIPLMAVGGVKISNVDAYLAAGASAVAVGGSIFSSNRLKTGDLDSIQQDLKQIVLAVGDFFSKMGTQRDF